jgi:hypothetical protein
MAQSTAFLTYDAVGNREDLSDVITNISPEETPMFSTFGKTKAKGTYHEWLTDSLADATDNAFIEGGDYTFVKVAPRARTGNYTQIFVTPVEVSDTQRSVDSAGIEDEFAYQMAKKLKEHARDIEKALVTGTGNAGASGTARRLKGVLSWITTNVETGTGTGAEALTETMFNNALQTIWNSGGRPDTAWVNGFQKRQISRLTASTTKTLDAEDKKLVAAVDVYESDFGVIKVKLDRFMDADKVAITQTDLWKVAVLRPTKKVDVAKVGSATRAVIETELTLEARNQAGSGKIIQLTTS